MNELPSDGTSARSLDVQLIPQFFGGPQVRYVLDESDALGNVIQLRKETGTITGTVAPIVQKGTVTIPNWTPNSDVQIANKILQNAKY